MFRNNGFSYSILFGFERLWTHWLKALNDNLWMSFIHVFWWQTFQLEQDYQKNNGNRKIWKCVWTALTWTKVDFQTNLVGICRGDSKYIHLAAF